MELQNRSCLIIIALGIFTKAVTIGGGADTPEGRRAAALFVFTFFVQIRECRR